MSSSPHEVSVLRPRDPSLLNSDYWPEFELKNAYIFDPEDLSAAPANLLHAGAYRPLTITGKLEPANKSNLHAWLDNSVHRSTSIQLTQIKEFSYGQYADGSLDIWAAGQAGWFTIRPARAYRDVYNTMVQAVKLLYFVADSYRALKRYADLPPAGLFQKCCDARLEKCKSVREVEAMFGKHRLFLIASMITGKEGLQWTRVPLHGWLHDTYPDDFQLVQQRVNHKPPKPASRKGSTQSPAPSTGSSRKRKQTAADRDDTPKSTVSRRSTRSTRSTRSQSVSTFVAVDTTNKNNTDQGYDVISTPNHANPNPQPESPTSSDEAQSSSARGRRGKGKSALRPRPSKYIPIKTKSSRTASSSSNSTRTAPRPGTIEDDEMPVDSPEPKQNQINDEQATESDEEEGVKPETSLPFRLQNTDENGDVWHCPVDGCMQKVYAASEPSSQLLVKAHEQTHEYDHDERIRLVRRMEAPWLPVNRLMDRVRGMASQTGHPPPLVQRY